MDSTQFQALLDAFNTQQRLLIETLKSQQLTSQHTPVAHIPSQSNCTYLPLFESFDPSKENFKLYRERFENYLALKGVLQDKTACLKMFLNSIGSRYYKLIVSLVAPNLPTEKTYEEIITVLEKHLCPKRNVLLAQHRFLSSYQQSSQTISEYVADLRQILVECECVCPMETCKSSVANLFLRAQFIRGIHDNSIREKLLQSKKMTFEDIFDEALALEACKNDSLEFSRSNALSVSHQTLLTQNVNKVQHKSRSNTRASRYCSNSRSSSPSRPNTSQKYRSPPPPASRTRLNFRQLGIDNRCFRCGRSNHTSRKCRISSSELQCTSCGKIGHVASICITTLMKQSSSNVNSTDSSNLTEISSFQNLRSINQIVDLFDKSCTSDSKKYLVEVLIAGKPQTFEVDSGTGLTLLPECDFQRLNLKNVPLQTTNVQFRSYTSGIFKPLGVVEVPVEYKGFKSKEILFVVPNRFSPLLGRTWIRHLNISLEDIDLQGKHCTCIEVKSTDVQCRFDDLKLTVPKQKKVSFRLPPSRQFHTGAKDLVRWYSNTKGSWRLGRVTKVLGSVHYQVQVENCYNLRRSADQLKKTETNLSEPPQDLGNKKDNSSDEPSSGNSTDPTRSSALTLPPPPSYPHPKVHDHLEDEPQLNEALRPKIRSSAWQCQPPHYVRR